MLAIRDYEQAPYLVLATRNGLVKKTRLGDYNSPRQAGVIAINFREDDDELIGAELVDADDDILLVSRKGQAIRFRADDTQLRPMGRATSGVHGHEVPRRRLAAVDVGDPRRPGRGRGRRRGRATPEAAVDVQPQYVFTITDGGFAKRTRITDYRLQSRGGLGIKAMSLANEDRGGLVGAFIVVEGDEILSITQGGQVVRSPINDDFRATGRSTMGVKFVTPKGGDAVAVVARSVETPEEVEAARGRRRGRGVHGRQVDESPDVGPDATIEAGRRHPMSRPSPTTDLLSIQRVRADDRALCRAGTCPDAPGPPGHRADPPGRAAPAPDQRLRRAPRAEPGADELGRVLPPPPPELTAQREREEAERLDAERQAAERQAAERQAAERQPPSSGRAAADAVVQTQSPIARPRSATEPARRTAAGTASAARAGPGCG